MDTLCINVRCREEDFSRQVRPYQRLNAQFAIGYVELVSATFWIDQLGDAVASLCELKGLGEIVSIRTTVGLLNVDQLRTAKKTNGMMKRDGRMTNLCR